MGTESALAFPLFMGENLVRCAVLALFFLLV